MPEDRGQSRYHDAFRLSIPTGSGHIEFPMPHLSDSLRVSLPD